MKTHRTLDFSLLRAPESMDIMIRLPGDIDTGLSSRPTLRELYDRARSSLDFLVKGGDGEAWRIESHLRAGLNEFYSLEDGANRAYRSRLRGASAPKIVESKHPLVHAMYALRHVNVHVKPTATERQQVPVVYQDPDNPHEFSMGATMLADETLTDVLSTKEAKEYYVPGDLHRVVSWLLDSQKTFGVGQVLRIGLEQYVREVLVCMPP